MPVLRNIGLLAQCPVGGGQDEIGLLSRAALCWDHDCLTWVGLESELPDSGNCRDSRVFDAAGHLVIPGLIDCHTHLAFAGWRTQEFVQRIQGHTYLEIARSGGGIQCTVNLTRRASRAELRHRCRGFLTRMACLGVTTVECKSGYGLDRSNEIKLLEVYQKLAAEGPQRMVATLLAAHTVPSEYEGRRAEYLDWLCGELIPEVAERNLARFCDVFVEESGFSIDEARRVLEKGKQHGLAAKLHADQLSPAGGAELAADLGAVSADHLEKISDRGIQALADSDVLAVNLPLASLYLHQQPLAARRLLESGVSVALGSDFNPGSAPSYHLPLAMLLASTLQKMTPAETLKGVTIQAARALQLERRTGSLEPGKSADFAVIDAPTVDHWLYHFQANACLATVARGTFIYGDLEEI